MTRFRPSIRSISEQYPFQDTSVTQNAAYQFLMVDSRDTQLSIILYSTITHPPTHSPPTDNQKSSTFSPQNYKSQTFIQPPLDSSSPFPFFTEPPTHPSHLATVLNFNFTFKPFIHPSIPSHHSNPISLKTTSNRSPSPPSKPLPK